MRALPALANALQGADCLFTMECYTLPPSPALSVCDSLDGIDLDAHLAAQGPLSLLPTPELRGSVNSATTSRRTSTTASRHAAEARLFVHLTECICSVSPQDVGLAEAILDQAAQPVEVLAIAYSILGHLTSSLELGSWRPDADLLLLAALALAENQITDCPRTLNFWAQLDSTRTISTRDVNQTKMQILESLGWSVHSHCHEDAVLRFRQRLTTPHHIKDDSARQDLPRLCMSKSTTALWAYGQLTPAEWSPCPDALHRTSSTYFIPLL